MLGNKLLCSGGAGVSPAGANISMPRQTSNFLPITHRKAGVHFHLQNLTNLITNYFIGDLFIARRAAFMCAYYHSTVITSCFITVIPPSPTKIPEFPDGEGGKASPSGVVPHAKPPVLPWHCRCVYVTAWALLISTVVLSTLPEHLVLLLGHHLCHLIYYRLSSTNYIQSKQDEVDKWSSGLWHF